MKNILLPTDFSENSRNAINYAMRFFENELCTFYILNVQKASLYMTDDLMAAPMNTSVHQSVINTSKEKLNELTKYLQKETTNQKYSFKGITDYDVFTDAIKQAVKSKKIDLVIMGSNGATGAREVVFGSNTLNVIRKVDCPVLVIPQGYVFENLKTVLYTIDDNDHFNTEGMDPLVDTVTKYKSSLRILKIKEDDTVTIAEFDDKKQLKDFFKNINHTFHSITNVPSALAIDSFVQIMNIDMNAMFIQKETFIERFFYGSETSKISYRTRVPLLIMKN
ncbi:Nucleotide-binding universal stress protein, UspA family [Aquimarina amphilecti]|uniref:Nucleotide-binding universal stress protein, UspA family n=1 Tax=Aquimarina amphilecti TaxID=1038014 RepID=A0A1H7MGI5_AQUAM|nr:universal stress protein [Aquimarina amphilecti]SEL10282.1 Nucleotide-binding universal stress protein, UspA family [Aquimarina amphilecti]